MNKRRSRVAVRALFWLALAALLFRPARPTPAPALAARSVSLRATVLDCVPTSDAFSITVTAGARRYLAFTRDAACVPGERVLLRGELRAFDPPRNPGGADERAAAARLGASARIDAARLTLIAPADPRDPRFWPARLRLWAGRILALALPPDEATVCDGMLWGDHHALSPEDRAAFSATGTSHLLVTAGLHLGFVALLARRALRLLTVARPWAAAGTLLVGAAACLVSGAHLPSLRALLMLTVVLGADALGTASEPGRALAFALWLVVAITPDDLGDPSFLLSFSCVAAIVSLAPPCEARLMRARFPRVLARPLAVSATAQLGTWALIASVFHVVSPIAPVANLVVIPLALVTLALAPGLLMLAALKLTAAVAVAAVPLHLALAALLTVVRGCARMPGAVFSAGSPQPWAVALYEAALLAACAGQSRSFGAACLRWAHRARLPRLRRALVTLACSGRSRRGASLLLLGLASLGVAASARGDAGKLRVTVLDVGQGDGIVIRTPRGHTVLVDSGGRLELHARDLADSPAERSAERVLPPFLRAAGVNRVDVLLLTHPHGDHAGGAAPVMRAFPVGSFLDGGQTYPGLAFCDALAEAGRLRLRRTIARRGDRLRFDDGVELEILAPETPLFRGGRNDVNENSIVALLRYRGFRMLFMGDAGFAAEQRLLARGGDLRADVLKVGHHGSAYATSDAFLRAVRPRLAVISVGRHNLFHHPAPPTLARLAARRIRVLRTDRCGAVTIDGDGGVSTMLPCEGGGKGEPIL